MVCESAEGIISSLLHGWFDVEQCNAGHTYLKKPNQQMGERIPSQGELYMLVKVVVKRGDTCVKFRGFLEFFFFFFCNLSKSSCNVLLRVMPPEVSSGSKDTSR